jgi:hypothetical protein
MADCRLASKQEQATAIVLRPTFDSVPCSEGARIREEKCDRELTLPVRQRERVGGVVSAYPRPATHRRRERVAIDGYKRVVRDLIRRVSVDGERLGDVATDSAAKILIHVKDREVEGRYGDGRSATRLKAVRQVGMAVATNADLAKDTAHTTVVAASRTRRTSSVGRICAGAHDAVKRHAACSANAGEANLMSTVARALASQVVDRGGATCARLAEVERDVSTVTDWHRRWYWRHSRR